MLPYVLQPFLDGLRDGIRETIASAISDEVVVRLSVRDILLT